MQMLRTDRFGSFEESNAYNRKYSLVEGNIECFSGVNSTTDVDIL